MIPVILMESWPIILHEYYKNRTRKHWLLKNSLFFLAPALIWFVGGVFGNFIDISTYGFKSYGHLLSSGLLAYILMGVTIGKSSTVVMERKTFSRQLLVAPISRLSILIGKTCSTLIGSFRVVLVYAVILMVMLSTLQITRLFLLPLVIIWLSLSYLSLGTWVSTLFKRAETVQNVLNTGVIFMVLLAGVFYPISSFPAWIRWITYVNPMTYSVELFRWAMVGTIELPLWLTLLVSMLFGLVSTGLGTIAFNRNLRK